jgi:hypothetical protein
MSSSYSWCVAIAVFLAASLRVHAGEVSIPIGANSWAADDAGWVNGGPVSAKDGITHWTNPHQRIRTFVWIGISGVIDLRLSAVVADGVSTIRWSMGSESGTVTMSATVASPVTLGSFTCTHPGYYCLELQGLTKTGLTFAEVTSLEIAGAAVPDRIHFIRDDVYFGRRGPSVHLAYQVPKEARDLVWCYTEVCVPVGQDVIGTYCMANGFSEGYSGMQVNSATERRFLFSVWSPFKTDNAAAIPEDQRIIVLKKGKDVIAKGFGGEGSGGQSFLVYPWKAGVVYGFLLGVLPNGDGTTTYTAYVTPKVPDESDQWHLIASFRRPKTTTYLTGWYSFLENFSPDTGALTREARYGNQWACDKDGHWFEAVRAHFTCDATAAKHARLDDTGGIADDGRFFLRNCGFFDAPAMPSTQFTRPATHGPPVIDVAALPVD